MDQITVLPTVISKNTTGLFALRLSVMTVTSILEQNL